MRFGWSIPLGGPFRVSGRVGAPRLNNPRKGSAAYDRETARIEAALADPHPYEQLLTPAAFVVWTRLRVITWLLLAGIVIGVYLYPDVGAWCLLGWLLMWPIRGLFLVLNRREV